MTRPFPNCVYVGGWEEGEDAIWTRRGESGGPTYIMSKLLVYIGNFWYLIIHIDVEKFK